jgi:hypothetical protein
MLLSPLSLVASIKASAFLYFNAKVVPADNLLILKRTGMMKCYNNEVKRQISMIVLVKTAGASFYDQNHKSNPEEGLR